ncbi:MAG TPA: DUF2235 domain-containing protein [Miltoncostaeaceae bacterium]|nr:DUF2235 domain-containing protein [Miltoncostaeaceae bacterium]
MARNLVLCADGTCNAFAHASNVARLVRHVALGPAQVACYDQGIGTRNRERRAVEAFRDGLDHPEGLEILPPPSDRLARPWTWASLLAAVTRGKGLEENVAQLYGALARRYAAGDRVFLFGFSRGAFTVRALAGLVWRHGLPETGDPGAIAARFAAAWPRFAAEYGRPGGADDPEAGRPCPIHFMGLWDTVKSYGGLTPVLLPHLRHNPCVATVRHAMALDERRGWFEVTTWGWLDADRRDGAAASRLPRDVAARLGDRDVAEVWFTGAHADVGGGAGNAATSDVALRWMLGEAAAAGLTLNADGWVLLARPDAAPVPSDPRSLFWRLVDAKARRRIDNGGVWPRSVPGVRGPSPRQPFAAARDGTVWIHESVRGAERLGRPPVGVALRVRRTRRAGSAPTS